MCLFGGQTGKTSTIVQLRLSSAVQCYLDCRPLLVRQYDLYRRARGVTLPLTLGHSEDLRPARKQGPTVTWKRFARKLCTYCVLCVIFHISNQMCVSGVWAGAGLSRCSLSPRSFVSVSNLVCSAGQTSLTQTGALFFLCLLCAPRQQKSGFVFAKFTQTVRVLTMWTFAKLRSSSFLINFSWLTVLYGVGSSKVFIFIGHLYYITEHYTLLALTQDIEMIFDHLFIVYLLTLRSGLSLW